MKSSEALSARRARELESARMRECGWLTTPQLAIDLAHSAGPCLYLRRHFSSQRGCLNSCSYRFFRWLLGPPFSRRFLAWQANRSTGRQIFCLLLHGNAFAGADHEWFSNCCFFDTRHRSRAVFSLRFFCRVFGGAVNCVRFGGARPLLHCNLARFWSSPFLARFRI